MGTGGISSLAPQGVRTEFAAGPARQRRVSGYQETTFQGVTLMMSASQFATVFLPFYKTSLNNGIGAFNAPVRLPSGAMGTRRCQIVSGAVSVEDLGDDTGEAGRKVTFGSLMVRDWI